MLLRGQPETHRYGFPGFGAQWPGRRDGVREGQARSTCAQIDLYRDGRVGGHGQLLSVAPQAEPWDDVALSSGGRLEPTAALCH